MKNAIKVFGIIALVAVIGFSMTACNKSGSGGGNGFNSASDFEFMNLGDSISIQKYTGKKTVVNIPPTIKKLPVVSIMDDAFYLNSTITSVTIPDGVVRIGYRVFVDCTSLASINIPASVFDIGGSAFSNCTSLTSITIPGKVKTIVEYAFAGCTSLTNVTIGDGVEQIGAGAFEGCTSLTSITLPKSVYFIGDKAFDKCTKLTSVTFGSKIDKGSFHEDAFCGDLRIKHLAGGAGTYTTTTPLPDDPSKYWYPRWTKQ